MPDEPQPPIDPEDGALDGDGERDPLDVSGGIRRVLGSDEDTQDRIPMWVIRAIVVFWFGYLLVGITRNLWFRLDGLALLLVISLFLALAIEPGVNRLARRGWRRGRATAAILFGVIIAAGCSTTSAPVTHSSTSS